MNLIAFSGQIDSGKTSASKYLTSRLTEITGQNWTIMSYAYNVKDIFCRTFNVTREFVEEWKRKDESPPGFDQSVRKSLIFIGDGYRQIQSHYWVNLLEKELINNHCIDDVRYLSEYTMVKKLGGINILIWRAGHENNIQNDIQKPPHTVPET